MVRIVQVGCSDINKFVTYATPTGKHQSPGVMYQRWLTVFRKPLVTNGTVRCSRRVLFGPSSSSISWNNSNNKGIM